MKKENSEILKDKMYATNNKVIIKEWKKMYAENHKERIKE